MSISHPSNPDGAPTVVAATPALCQVHADSIDELKEMARENKRGIALLSRQVGEPPDATVGQDGTGLCKHVVVLIQQVAQLRADVAALRDEQGKRRSSPLEFLRWTAVAVPVAAFLCGAIWWIATHVRLIP